MFMVNCSLYHHVLVFFTLIMLFVLMSSLSNINIATAAVF